MMSKALL